MWYYPKECTKVKYDEYLTYQSMKFMMKIKGMEKKNYENLTYSILKLLYRTNLVISHKINLMHFYLKPNPNTIKE